MILTILAAGSVLLYGYGLGAAAVMVWRLYRGPLRYAPALTTALYYWAALDAHPPVFLAIRDGTVYPAGDAIRVITASMAFGLGLLMLALKAKGK